MADNIDIPYSPPQYILSRSLLDREQLVSEYESFKQSLQYVSRAPEVVFERLIGNVNETVISRLNKQRAVQLAERQELEKRNEALREMVANLDKVALQQKSEHATRQELEKENEGLKEKTANQLKELQELEKTNAALKGKVANLERVTSRQENERAIQLAELQELKDKVEQLGRFEEVNAELEAKLRGLEAELQAFRIPRNPKEEYRDSVRTILETVINRIS